MKVFAVLLAGALSLIAQQTPTSVVGTYRVTACHQACSFAPTGQWQGGLLVLDSAAPQPGGQGGRACFFLRGWPAAGYGNWYQSGVSDSLELRLWTPAHDSVRLQGHVVSTRFYLGKPTASAGSERWPTYWDAVYDGDPDRSVCPAAVRR